MTTSNPQTYVQVDLVLRSLTSTAGDKCSAQQWCRDNIPHVSPEVATALVSDHDTPRDLLARLSRHPHYTVRAIVAASPELDETTLHNLAFDESPWVRRVIVNNPASTEASKAAAYLAGF